MHAPTPKRVRHHGSVQYARRAAQGTAAVSGQAPAAAIAGRRAPHRDEAEQRHEESNEADDLEAREAGEGEHVQYPHRGCERDCAPQHVHEHIVHAAPRATILLLAIIVNLDLHALDGVALATDHGLQVLTLARAGHMLFQLRPRRHGARRPLGLPMNANGNGQLNGGCVAGTAMSRSSLQSHRLSSVPQPVPQPRIWFCTVGNV